MLTISTETLRVEEAEQEVVGLVRYWLARKPSMGLPTRRDIDPIDLRSWLGRISLFEVVGEGELRCRLRGSMKNASPGHIRDGVLLSHVQPREYAAFGTEQLLSTYAAAAPSLHAIDLNFDGLLHRYQRLALPLASGGDLPPMLLTYARWNTRAADEFWRRYFGRDYSNQPGASALPSS
jgi:hypothetical protein